MSNNKVIITYIPLEHFSPLKCKKTDRLSDIKGSIQWTMLKLYTKCNGAVISTGKYYHSKI